MKIVRIQSRICVGGPALHSILLSEGLSYRRGARYDTTLLGGALEPGEVSMAPFAEARGVSVELVPEMKRSVHPVRDARALARTVRRLRELRPTIVHTHTAKAGAIGRTAAALVGAPIVVHTFHGHVFEGYFDARKAAAFVAAERALARATDVILAISEQQRADLSERYRIAPAEKIRVVPLGLELERFRAVTRRTRGALRAELGIPAEAPLVMAVGRLVPIKRFDLLLQAFREVLARLPEAHLAIAGDGAPELRAELERLARPMAGRVHFLGWRRDLERLYADADVLALTSDNEGTPVTVIEAVASGLPVVATRVGGVEDVLTDAMGTMVAPGDVAGIARALVARLSSPGPLADSLRDDVCQRFSHRRLIGDVERLYDELLEQRRASRALRSRAAALRAKEAAPC
jgi:glycosyltransferase involved in cell wall biosynthesis